MISQDEAGPKYCKQVRKDESTLVNIKSKTVLGSGSKECFDLLDSTALFFDGIGGGVSWGGGAIGELSFGVIFPLHINPWTATQYFAKKPKNIWK